MSGAAWQICERCDRRCYHYDGDRCAQCKREDKRRADERAARLQREQEARGRVGDEVRAKAAMESFDAFSRAVRAAAGVPVGGGR